MMDTSPDTLSTASVTGAEEQFWLLQEQHPERVLKQLCAWRLAAGTDLATLTQTLEQLVQALPDLNARYHFSDDGDLGKHHVAGAQACVEVFHCPSLESAIERLRACQSAPWDATRHPPFQALIARTEEETVLGLVVHQVLSHALDARALYARIALSYDAQPPLPPGPLLEIDIEDLQNIDAPIDAGVSGERAAVTAIILGEFRAALEAPDMQASDDFFEFGGHSLLATRIIGKLLSSHRLELGFNDFFSAPSAAALASRAKVNASQASAAQPCEAQPDAPFALAQASLGRAYEAFGFGTIFNLPFAVSFLDPVDEALFEQAFSDLIRRHASLRTTFHFKAGNAWQHEEPIEQVTRFKWFWHSRESSGISLAHEANWRFDLSRELPVRVRFLTDPGSSRQTLSLLVHHMAIDEWSLNVMMQELAVAYRARAADTAPNWSAPAPAFHTFAARQHAAGVNRHHLDYWTGQLRGTIHDLRLPGAAPLNQAPSTQAQWLELVPEQAITDRLHAFARQQESSLFSVVYAAIALALHKLGDLPDLVIGTSASGRTDPAYYDTVGYFTTMVAHRVRFDAGQSVAALIAAVTRTINDSMPYADVPLEQIQQALGMSAADGLLFDVYVQIHANNALNGALTAADGTPIRYRQIDPDKNQSMFGLQFEIMDNLIDGQRVFRLLTTYRCERFCSAQVERLNDVISQLLTLFTSARAASRTLDSIEI